MCNPDTRELWEIENDYGNVDAGIVNQLDEECDWDEAEEWEYYDLLNRGYYE